jgi:hypothetical protein
MLARLSWPLANITWSTGVPTRSSRIGRSRRCCLDDRTMLPPASTPLSWNGLDAA